MRYIDERILSLATRRGFVDTFWAELRERRSVQPDTSQQDVFEYLENLYEAEFGSPQFSSFGAFRKWRDRHSAK